MRLRMVIVEAVDTPERPCGLDAVEGYPAGPKSFRLTLESTGRQPVEPNELRRLVGLVVEVEVDDDQAR